nr:serine hydrolase domain-containing protein [uncultured Flavobacterium sp.]
MNKYVYSIILIITVVSTTFSQAFDTRKTDDFIDYIEENNRAIGNVSIFQNGKEIYQRKFGDNTFDSNNNAYRIASVTKLITATLIFQLIEQEKLNLKEPLSNYFPQIQKSELITIEQLLSHKSGLADVNYKENNMFWLLDKPHTEEELLDNILSQEILFEPGTNLFYSNSGYFLLGQILEIKHKKKYPEIVKEQITIPLNLKTLKSGDNKLENVHPSLKFESKEWKKQNDFLLSNIISFGDITASTNDLNIFINALFDYKIISKESIEMMKPEENESFGGRGLTRTFYYEHLFLGHGGDSLGSHTFLRYNEKDKISIAININGNRNILDAFYDGIVNSLYELNFPKPIFLSDEVINKYVGTYESDNFPNIIFYNIDQDLYGEVQFEGEEKFALNPIKENSFKHRHIKVEFDLTNEIMVLSIGDKNYNFKKIKNKF